MLGSPPEDRAEEALMMGLRLTEGVDLARYEALSGRALDPDRLAALLAHGMVESAPAPACAPPLPGFTSLMRWSRTSPPRSGDPGTGG